MNRRSALPSIVALLHCQKRRSPTSETLSLGGQAGANFHPHDANLSPCLFGSSRRPSRLGLMRARAARRAAPVPPPPRPTVNGRLHHRGRGSRPPPAFLRGLGCQCRPRAQSAPGPPCVGWWPRSHCYGRWLCPCSACVPAPPPLRPQPPPEDASRPPLPPLTLLLFATQVIPPSRPSASPLPFTPATAAAAATSRCCTSNTPFADLRTLTAKIGGADGAATCKGSTLT